MTVTRSNPFVIKNDANDRDSRHSCTNVRTAASPFLMARVVLSVLTRKDVAVISSLAPVKSAWRPDGNRKSGQMMCYKPRTSSRATDSDLYRALVQRVPESPAVPR